MLNKIKSLFVLKNIFSHIYEGTKLDLIIYNKELKNKLKIDVIDYRRLSKKYIIGERNGYALEYNSYNDQLIFEGEYKNGKRNGKGKEYDENNILVFEGEYKNGKRNGKGKEYATYLNKGTTVQFEGIYLNGRRNGFGIDRSDGNLIYEGLYYNGKKYGKGKEYSKLKNSNGEYFYLFDGEYLNNHKVRGKEYINGKLEYVGEYLYDKKFNGKGYDENGKVIYELNNGEGKVKEYNYNGNLLYEGKIKNILKNGKVKEYENNILIFSIHF